MYQFAILALLALATVKLVDFASDSVEVLRPYRSLATFALAIAGVFALDYSVFVEWDVAIRNTDLGILITGLMIAGMTVAWRAAFAWLTHDRATVDETLGGSHRPVKAA